MKLWQAVLIVVIIIITTVAIVYLNKENELIKASTRKEIVNNVVKEGFVTSVNGSYPLREFIVKSSYNSAIKDGIASKEQLTELLNKGVRAFDFEIYTRDGQEYLSYSLDQEHRTLETDLTLKVDDAFSHISSKAFSEPNSGPLFLHMRVKTPSSATFQRLTDNLQNAFGSRLLDKGTVVNGSTFYNTLIDKVVIIHDLTSGNKPENFPCPNEEKCLQYTDLVNVYSGTIDLPLYSQLEYTESMGLSKKVSVDMATGKTDIGTYFMVAPSSFESKCVNRQSCGATTLMETMKTKPCQIILMRYTDDNKELEEYEEIFKKAGSSYCSVAQYLAMLNEKNVEI